MTGMDGKKDPGKFTFRFNLCDPRQRRAAELLNRQGRSKAQFIANAMLHYVDSQPSASQGGPAMDSEQLRLLVEDILAQRQSQPQQAAPAPPAAPADNDPLNDTERHMIFETLNAFKKQ